eukprot:15466088-Alexandrium_andersonii.AAC.1
MMRRISKVRMVSEAAACAWAVATALLRGTPPESAALLSSAGPSWPAKTLSRRGRATAACSCAISPESQLRHAACAQSGGVRSSAWSACVSLSSMACSNSSAS